MLDLSRTQLETATHEINRGMAIATLCILVMGSQLGSAYFQLLKGRAIQAFHVPEVGNGEIRLALHFKIQLQNVSLESCLLGIEVAPTIGVKAVAHLGCGKILGFLAVRKINRFGV